MAYIQQSGSATTARLPKSKFTAKTESKELLKENIDRIEITISNEGSKDVWLSLGSTAVAKEGIYLKNSGGSYTTNAYLGSIFCITAEGESNLCFSEI